MGISADSLPYCGEEAEGKLPVYVAEQLRTFV